MRGSARRRARSARGLGVALLMFAGLLLVAPVPHAVAVTSPRPLTHSGTGKAINMMVVGDSFVAGNGAGEYYDISPDDPSIPPAEFSGEGCYRSHRNASYLAYRSLGSRGFFINRACSGMETHHVAPIDGQSRPRELDGIVGTPTAVNTDLIVLSTGGNDVAFGDIARHCILMGGLDSAVLVGGKRISVDCENLLRWLATKIEMVIDNERRAIEWLLGQFPNAHVVLNGYPMLHARRPDPRACSTTFRFLDPDGYFRCLQSKQDIDTANYAYGKLGPLMLNLRDKQHAMVGALNGAHSGRVAFNDVFSSFGGAAGNHGIFSADPWILSLTLPSWKVSVHPNGTGHTKIAGGIVTQVNAKSWFASVPVQTKKAPTVFYAPSFQQPASGRRFTTGTKPFYTSAWADFGTTSRCLPDRATAFQAQGWVGARANLAQTSNGPDLITIICENPRTGDIAIDGSRAFYAQRSTATAIPVMRPIPTGWMFNCLNAKAGIRRYPIGGTYIATGTPMQGPNIAHCVPGSWRNRVLTDAARASWFVDANGYRHHIRSIPTYQYLTRVHGPAITVPVQVDVDYVPRGADQREQLDAVALEGKIVRRGDGTSYVVAGGQTHHLPTYATDVCAQYRQRRTVAFTGLSYALTSSIPEGSAWACDLNRSILHQTDAPDPRPAYSYHDGRRFWISDGWTYKALVARGWPVLEIPGAAISGLSSGGTETPLLNPADVPRNTIIRRNDGVSWVVDGSGYRHHIPYAQDDVCWRNLRGLSVSATNLTAGQANSLVEKDRWPCIIGQRIVKSSNGAIYTVDTSNTRHWIPDMETYGELARSQPVSGPWPAADVNLIPEGGREAYRINPDSVRNSIICRNDGVCWVVDGNAVRHHIPDYASNVCWRWVNGWRVSRSGLNYEQAASLPEGGAWGCSLDGYIFATNEGASYWMQGNTRRWIQDVESFYAYAEWSHRVIRGISMSEIRPLGEGGWMPQRLSPNRVRYRVVRAVDGTAYYITGDNIWHWIPDGGTYNCLVSAHGELIHNASWEAINSIRRENGQRAYCGM